MYQRIIEKIEILKGNIVNLHNENGVSIEVNAIVNAAKPSLMGGSGVDGAIHKAINDMHGIDYLKNEIKEKLDGNIINAKENRIRCNTSEVVVTEGYGLCDYIFHTVGPVWDEGSKSCVAGLQKCYENIIDKMLETNCETIAIPVISSGSYGFSFDLAAKIQIVSISNYLIKLKKRDSLKYDQIEKIYLVVYTENNIEQYKKIFDLYRENIIKEKKSYYQNLDESEKSYILEIENNDYSKRGYFSGVRALRLILLKIQKLFFITYYMKSLVFNRNWEERRKFIDFQVFIKMLFPIIGLVLSEKLSYNMNYSIGIIIVISMSETIIYVLNLIFLADIQNPSANIYRSIILLFANYIEITFGFAFLYNFFNAFKDSSIIKCICFAFTNQNVEIANDPGYILASIQSAIMIMFSGLIFAYFVNNFKQRKFY